MNARSRLLRHFAAVVCVVLAPVAAQDPRRPPPERERPPASRPRPPFDRELPPPPEGRGRPQSPEDVDRPPPPRRDRERPPPERERERPPQDREDPRQERGRMGPDRRDRLWREAVESMTDVERRMFQRASPEAKERAVREAVKRRAEKEEAAFLATLTDDERAALAALANDPEQRRRRMVELRVGRHFELAAEEAAAAGVVEKDEIETLRTAPLLRRVEATLEFRKRVFLAAHREDLAGLPEGERERLGRTPADRFFDDPFVRDFKSFRFLVPAEIARLRAADGALVRALLDAMRDGEVDEAAATKLFSKERAAALAKLRGEDRRRIGRDLARLVVVRDDDGGWQIPPSLMDDLSEEEAREVSRLTGVARRAYAIRRFGAKKLLDARREALIERMPQRLRERFRELAEEEQNRIADLPGGLLRRELAERFPNDAPASQPPHRRPPR